MFVGWLCHVAVDANSGTSGDAYGEGDTNNNYLIAVQLNSRAIWAPDGKAILSLSATIFLQDTAVDIDTGLYVHEALFLS